MGLSPQLLQILVCPTDKGGLYYLADEDALYNPRLHHRDAFAHGVSAVQPGVVERVLVGQVVQAALVGRADEDL